MTTDFTKEQLKTWAKKLIEETRSDIAISRTDAHAESYRAQLELLEIAAAALGDGPTHEATSWQVDEAVARMEGEADMVVVPRGVLGAASGAIRHPRHESGVTLGLLRHYSFRKQPAAEPVVSQVVVINLVMMVKMLCRTVKKYNPTSQQAIDFTAYLQREGLISSTDCLRDDAKAGE